MPVKIDARFSYQPGLLAEYLHTRLVTGDPGFMCFHENIVNTLQNIRPVEQGFEQGDFCTFDIYLEESDVFIKVFEIPDKIDLSDFDSSLFSDIYLAGNNGTRFRF